MRRFDAEYLAETRRGMWADSREALAALDLSSREQVLDVGSGTGALTRILRAESPGQVLGVDADRTLLREGKTPAVVGDARRLPFVDDGFDLVVCQALLINLEDPIDTVREFVRLSEDRVAAIEPDNSAVTVESTVDAEISLAKRARQWYLQGIDTDVALGPRVGELFDEVGLRAVRTDRYDHVRRIEPPYSSQAFESARRKATGDSLADSSETILASGIDQAGYDELRESWRAMGRTVIDQMQVETYRRVETVPFYVTVGQV